MYSLENAISAGLMDEVVDQDALMDKAKEKKASDLSTMGHPSYSMTKELFIADALKKINDGISNL